MADIYNDGKERWDWVPSIANKQAPTVAELNAGIRHLAVDDQGRGDRLRAGHRRRGDLEHRVDVRHQHQRPPELLRPAAAVQEADRHGHGVHHPAPDATGFLVRRKSLTAATAYASTQPVQVFPVICGETSWLDVDDNQLERFDVPIKMTDQPALRAAVA
jgi:hypothetical protein